MSESHKFLSSLIFEKTTDRLARDVSAFLGSQILTRQLLRCPRSKPKLLSTEIERKPRKKVVIRMRFRRCSSTAVRVPKKFLLNNWYTTRKAQFWGTPKTETPKTAPKPLPKHPDTVPLRACLRTK